MGENSHEEEAGPSLTLFSGAHALWPELQIGKMAEVCLNEGSKSGLRRKVLDQELRRETHGDPVGGLGLWTLDSMPSVQS